MQGLGGIIFVILVLGVIPILNDNMVFAEQPITISAESASYESGEKIVISGTVQYVLPGYAVTITVISSNGNLVTVSQVDVNEDKTFEVIITAGGMMSDGTHTVNVQYGDLKSETSFEYNDVTENNNTTMKVMGTELSVEYTIIGGTLLSVTPDLKSKSLVLSIDGVQDGTITLDIPRTVADSILDTGGDDTFIVLVDGEDTRFVEVISATHRTVTVPISAGTTQIEIIGTFVIPEFGSMVMLILVVSIISIIAISSKSRLSIIPKR